MPNTESALVRDNTIQEVRHGSLNSLEGHNPLNSCPNGKCEEFIGIYAKSKCQWNSCLIKTKLGQGRYGRLRLEGP